MNEPLPSRRHSFTCLSNATEPISGEVFYLDSAVPYLLAHIDPSRVSEDQQELSSYLRELRPLVDDGGGCAADSVPSSYSYYASPPSSIFSTNAPSLASPHPSTSDALVDHHSRFEEKNGARLDHADFESCNEHQPVLGVSENIGWTTTENIVVDSWDQNRRRLSSGGKSAKKARKKCAVSNGFPNSARSNKPLRVTHFNLKPTYIPPPTPRMSMCGAGSDCDGANHHHHLISTNDYVVTIEQLKHSRERAREKVRRIVVGVSVTLTLIAVVLVTAFLALGTKLEQRGEHANIADRGEPLRKRSHVS